MKKMISLAVILSCVLSVPAFADGPNDGHRQGSQRCGRTVRTMMGMRRRADLTRIIRATMTSVARIATVMANAIRHVMSRTISPGAGTISAKDTRLRRRSVAMNIASATGATAACRPRRKAITGPISTVTMC